MSQQKTITITMQPKSLGIEFKSKEWKMDIDDIYFVLDSYLMDYANDSKTANSKEYSVMEDIRNSITNFTVPAQEIETTIKSKISVLKDVLTIEINFSAIFLLNIFKMALDNYEQERNPGRNSDFIESFTNAVQTEINNY